MVVKAALRCDLSEREVPALRQGDRALNAKAKDELMRRDADGVPEQPREMEWTNADATISRQVSSRRADGFDVIAVEAVREVEVVRHDEALDYVQVH